MQNTRDTRRILCVNCNLCVNTLRRHLVLSLDTKIINVICEWISPVIIAEEDHICNECWQLAIQHIGVKNEPGSSFPRGHSHVCILCGKSILNRRSDLILKDNPSVLQQSIKTEVENRYAPRQLTTSDRVCHPCWMSVKRSVQIVVDNKLQLDPEFNARDPLELGKNHESEPRELKPNVPELHLKEEPCEPEPNEPESLSENCHEETVAYNLTEIPGTIDLNKYRRAANTASHCVFHTCPNRDLQRISDCLRATVLSNHKFYIPKLARVCKEHLLSNNWAMLFDSGNSLRTFTLDQVEHVFTFVNAFNRFLDFSSVKSIEESDDNLFGYCLGMSKKQFLTLLNEVPSVKETHQGLLGFGALLLKKKTGDSDEKLSLLLQTPRRTLERHMNKVREILEKDSLGINHETQNG